MVFSSLTFIYIFLPIVLMGYYLVPNKFRNAFILLSGLFFYAWGEPIYVVIMVASTLIDFFAGLVIFKAGSKPGPRKAALIVSIVMNLSLLGFFKYSAFIVENINAIFGTHYGAPTSLLPIGISFFTFQSMSYTMDLYKGNISVQKNPITFAAFVTLFPQIVAGPIVRYEDIEHELNERIVNVDMLWEGVVQFVTGLGKKVLIANNIGVVWDNVKAMASADVTTATAWLGIGAYTLQIYFDFSGYSDMAIGLGKMLGFHFPKNFDYPYMAKSISEFWRRWHITLSAWFKSYVYFPLGGSRKGLKRTVLNLAIVWLLTGIWHGASWNFILWGCLYGVVIITEKLVTEMFKSRGRADIFAKIPSVIKRIYAIVLVMLGWVLFDTSTIGEAFSYMGKLFSFGATFADAYTKYVFVNFGVLFAIAIVGCTNAPKKMVEAVGRKVPSLVNYGGICYVVGTLLLVTAYLVNSSYNPFLYFNF